VSKTIKNEEIGEASTTQATEQLAELKRALKKLRVRHRNEREELLEGFGVSPDAVGQIRIQTQRDHISNLRERLKRSSVKLDKTRAALAASNERVERLQKRNQKLKARIKSKQEYYDSKKYHAQVWRDEFADLVFPGDWSVDALEDRIRSRFLGLFEERALGRALYPALKLMRSGELGHANDFLQALDRSLRIQTPVTLMQLLSYVQAAFHSRAGATDNPDLLVHFAVWGAGYTSRFLEYCLPSLLAPDNLPAIGRERRVRVLIHTDDASLEALGRAPLLHRLQEHCELDIQPYPGSLTETSSRISREDAQIGRNASYLFLGAFQSIAIDLASRARARVMLLVPDIVIEEHLFPRIDELFGHGYKIVTCQTPTIDFGRARSVLGRARRPEGSISISPEALAGLQVKHLHPAFAARCVTPGNGDFYPCAQQLFPYQDGFVIRALHYHPIAISPEALDHLEQRDLGILPADDYVLSSLVDGENVRPEEVYLPASTRDVALIGLGESDGSEFAISVDDPSKTLDAMSKAYIRMLKSRPITPFEQYCLEHRVMMSSGTQVSTQAGDLERSFFEPILEHLRTLQESTPGSAT